MSTDDQNSLYKIRASHFEATDGSKERLLTQIFHNPSTAAAQGAESAREKLKNSLSP